jgi:predicted CoA-binding protein
MEIPGGQAATVGINRPEVIEHLLTDAQVWFVVGLRDNPQRAAYRVAQMLLGLGKTVVPIHPAAQHVHGCKGYPTITAATAAVGKPDVVDIFLRPVLVAPIVDEAIAVGAGAVWLQLGVIDQPSADRARVAGLGVVMDRCPAIEWPRLRR